MWLPSLSKISLTWWWARCTNCKFLWWYSVSLLFLLLFWNVVNYAVLELWNSDVFFKFSPLCCDKNSLSGSDMMECITLEKNGKTLEFFPGELSTDRITAIQVLFMPILMLFPSLVASWRVNFIPFHLQCPGSVLEYGICTFWSWWNRLYWSWRGSDFKLSYMSGFYLVWLVNCSLYFGTAWVVDHDSYWSWCNGW